MEGLLMSYLRKKSWMYGKYTDEDLVKKVSDNLEKIYMSLRNMIFDKTGGKPFLDLLKSSPRELLIDTINSSNDIIDMLEYIRERPYITEESTDIYREEDKEI